MPTWCRSAVNRSFFLVRAACRTRSSPCVTLSRFCARRVLCWLAFPLVPTLRSTGSATGRPALFVGFVATTVESDFSCPCIGGYGSSPSHRGPAQPLAARPGLRSPRFRRVPFVRDRITDLGRAPAPRMAASYVLPSTLRTVSASAAISLSRLNNPPHTIAVYASPWSSPSTSQHSLPGGRYPLPGPDFHRLDRASFAWRTRNGEQPCHGAVNLKARPR
jgi:hypothetical protein